MVNQGKAKSWPEPERLLVVMPTWVGDVVMATPALRALRARFPQSRITLLIHENARDVVRGGPWADAIEAWAPLGRSVQRIGGLVRTARRLRRGRFDWAVLLSNSFRSALTIRLAGIPRRIGYDREGRGWLLTDRLTPARSGRRYTLISTVHYYNALAGRLGCGDPGERLELCLDAEDEAAVEDRLERWGLGSAHPLVVINAGASFGNSKLWIPERYAEVADRLVRERAAAVVITFGPGERALAERVHDAMRERSRVMDDPPCTLGQLKSLIARADLLLNNDTGPRHFAKAFHRRVVTVFGSTHPGWTYTDYPRERMVRIEVDCGPCHKKVCPYAHHKCMTGITSDMVYEAAVALLDERRTDTPLPVVGRAP